MKTPHPFGGTVLLPEYAWCRHWPDSRLTVQPASAARSCRWNSLRGCQTGSRLLPAFLDRRPQLLHVSLQKIGRDRESDRRFRKQPHFTVEAHVISIVLDNLPAGFKYRGIRPLRRVHLAHELEVEIDVL